MRDGTGSQPQIYLFGSGLEDMNSEPNLVHQTNIKYVTK